jgi:hypothetical protein
VKPSECAREGDDYLVQWDTLGLGLEFTRVRESDAAIRALATPVRLADRKRLLAPVWVNLFTLADRERVAKAITERIEDRDAPKLAEWKDSIEHAFGAVIDLHSRPEPLLNLAEMPLPADEGELLSPVLFRNQVNVLLADQGAGKSYNGLYFAACVSAGLGDRMPEPFRLNQSGPVLYYDAETNWEAQRRRLERISAALRLPTLPNIHYRQLRPPLAQHAARIRADVAMLGAVFVVFDSLTFLAGGDLNSTEVSVPTMNTIGDAGPCTKLALAHHGKAGRREGERPSALGSSAFEFKARSIWLIRRESDPSANHIDQAWVWFKGNDARPHPGFGLRLRFNESNTEVAFENLTGEQSTLVGKHTGTVEDKIRSALLDTELWKANTAELARATGLNERSVRRAAQDMPDVRLVEGGGRGRGNVSVFELHRSSGVSQGAKSSIEKKTDIKTDPYIYRENVRFVPNGTHKTDKTDRAKTDKTDMSVFESDDELMNLPF